MIQRLLVTIGVVCIVAACWAAQESESIQVSERNTTPTVVEFRGVWAGTRSFNTPEKIKRFLDRLEQANMNGIIAIAYLNGFACYPSDIAPRSSDSINPDDATFDPLGELIAAAHKRGIQVHVYLTSVLNNRFPKVKNHALTLHPEWATADQTGTSLMKYSKKKLQKLGVEGVYLDPGNLEARKYIVDIHIEVMKKYDIDGIQFDYIRFPGTYQMNSGSYFPGIHFGYNRESRKRFQEEHGYDPLDMLRHRDRYIKKWGQRTYRERCTEWDKWRRDQITAIVREVRAEQKIIKPHLWVSAAAIAFPDRAYLSLCQDWRGWLDEGLLDAVAPMAYSTDTELVKYMIRTAVANARPGQQVWAGLGAYMLGGKEGELVRQVELSRAAGARGVVFFASGSITRNDALVELLRTSCFRTPALPPKLGQ
jgi:uncharacterized lipoprotein YddW (UPF0748 family)